MRRDVAHAPTEPTPLFLGRARGDAGFFSELLHAEALACSTYVLLGIGVFDEPVTRQMNRESLHVIRTTLIIIFSLFAVIVIARMGYTVWTIHSVGELGKAMYADDRAKFGRVVWLDASPDDGAREQMLDDLRANYLTPGMLKRDVESLLGKEDSGDPGCAMAMRDACITRLCYRVVVAFDPCVLVLGFDSADRLVETAKDCS